jgi:hypothetical protein
MPPITYTRAQFAATPTGKKPGSSYSKYIAFVNKRRAANAAAPVDPFAPQSPQQINQQVNKFAGMYGTPMPAAQIQTTAQGMIDPIIAAITAKIGGQAKTSSDAIAANAADLASKLGAIDYTSAYTNPKQEQAAADAALQQSLSGGGGTQLAGDLSSRLAQINDPSVAAAAAGLAGRGAAIGTTELAHGTNALSSLIANAAAAGSYGQKMPGIAQLSGLQDIAGVGKQATSDIADQTAQIESQLPTIVGNLNSQADTTRANRAQAAAQIYQALTGQNITKATASAGLVTDATNAAVTQDYNNARVGIAQQNANTAASRAAAAAATAAAKAAKTKAPKPLTVSEKQDAAATANTIAAQAFKGVPAVTRTNANGTVTVVHAALPKLSYQQALDEMRQEGLLADARTAAIAMQALNRVYGKPLTATQQAKQNAAVKSGAGLPVSPMAPGSPLYGGK